MNSKQNGSQAQSVFSPNNDGRTATSYRIYIHDARAIPGINSWTGSFFLTITICNLLDTYYNFSSEADSSTVLTPFPELHEDDAGQDSLPRASSIKVPRYGTTKPSPCSLHSTQIRLLKLSALSTIRYSPSPESLVLI